MSHEQSLLARKLHLALNSVEAMMVTTGLPKQTIVEAILRELAGYVVVAAAPLMQAQRALVNEEPFEAYHKLRVAADPYMTVAHGNDGNHWADWEAAERGGLPLTRQEVKVAVLAASYGDGRPCPGCGVEEGCMHTADCPAAPTQRLVPRIPPQPLPEHTPDCFTERDGEHHG